MKQAIRILLVDDEPLARERLRTLLDGEPEAQVVAEAADGEEAVARIRESRPDVVFLDIQMPGLDAFAVIDQVGAEEMPPVVFATAFDDFALRAFDANAIDYLVKPIGEERLRRAMERVRSRIGVEGGERFSPQFLQWLAEQGASRGGYRERLAVRRDGGLQVVRTADIQWIEAADNYVRLHLGKASHLHRATIGEMEGMLDPAVFLRVHRSAIVNVNAVETIQPWGMGEFLFVLGNGAKITSSRRYRRPIRDAFGC